MVGSESARTCSISTELTFSGIAAAGWSSFSTTTCSAPRGAAVVAHLSVVQARVTPFTVDGGAHGKALGWGVMF
jgi:hypothetical protein